MAVKVSIKGDKKTNEYKDALVLKEIFDNEFSGASIDGDVLIISNVTLIGQNPKDIDIIALGKFGKYLTKIDTKSKSSDSEISKLQERTVDVKDFCFVFETKRHIAEDIRLEGISLLVSYNSKPHDVTNQSEKQKYSLKNYFEGRLGFSPYICNFILLRNVSNSSINALFDNTSNAPVEHNFLPTTFNIKLLFRLACIQLNKLPNYIDNNTKQQNCLFRSFKYNRGQEYDISAIGKIFDLFTTVRDGMGSLTRLKIEQITRGILKNQQYAQAIGEKLVIISGRAGTGKTIKLLTIACDLTERNGARSLILTYNHALVSDIQRILAGMEMPDDIDDYTVSISTLHKFFYEILVGFEIGTEKTKNNNLYIPNYISQDNKNYNKLLEELHEYIESGVIGKSELENLMKSRHHQIAWDYILIDEAQDWSEIEKKIIFSIFGKEKVIIADGVDQLIRSQKKINWRRGLSDNDFRQTAEKKGLRQKAELVNFVGQVAEKLHIPWDVEPRDDLFGGKIIIKIGEYTKELHEKEFKLCKDNGNIAYDMMFLVPPSLTDNQLGTDKFGNPLRSFTLKNEFAAMGIKIWDGTKRDLRSSFSVDTDEHRLFQYDSCRGLEGWTVACLDLDEFVRYKFDTFKEVDVRDGEQFKMFSSLEHEQNKFVSKWALIPLTRAIDTLIITIKNKDSEIGIMLRAIYQKNPDTMQWIE